VIEAAINGSRTRTEHPGIPVTPEEQARAARDSLRAGADAIHVHVRGADGRESLAGDDAARSLRAIRDLAPGTPIGVSTGAWIIPDPDARLSAVSAWGVLPDFASVNFSEEGAERLAELLLSRGVAVEAGVSTRAAAEIYAESRVAPSCLRILIEPREQEVNAALATVSGIQSVLDRARASPPRLLHGTEGTVWPLVDAAAACGYDTRVGFEDTLVLPDGRTARSNATLVAEARRRIESAVRRE